jgi:hypothetical protein
MGEEEILKIIIDGGRRVESLTACSRDAVIAFRATPGGASIDWQIAAELADAIKLAGETFEPLAAKLIRFIR